MKINTPKINRRSFLKGAAALPAVSALSPSLAGADAGAVAGVLVSDFVRVTPEDRIVVVVKHFEAGQGPSTGLATLVAEEMNADWKKIDIVFAPADNARYANLLFGLQGTGGSTAVANSFVQYRKAGALALTQLRAAAAAQWNTQPEKIIADNGVLIFGDQRATYGEMAATAATLPPPAVEPPLKKPADFVYIGKDKRPRKDIAGKINGSAQYAMDVRPDNLLYVVVARSPKFGGVLKTFDDSAARNTPGFAAARAIFSGVAVYGETLWAAIKARRALKTEWDFSAAEQRSSAEMLAEYNAALDKTGIPAPGQHSAAEMLAEDNAALGTMDGKGAGDIDEVLENTAKSVVDADFSFPFLAHAPMEPLNCVIQFRDGRVTLWDGCQFPGTVQGAVASVFGVMPDKVDIVSTFAGGSFGRRATPTNDYQVEAAQALKLSPHGTTRPLKLLWTREDDIRGGYYRPMFAHRVRAGIDADGNLVAWRQRLAGKSIAMGTPFEAFIVKDGVDNSSVEGVTTLPYAVPNMQIDVHNMKTPVPVLWWRSVGHSHTAFSTEVVMDMLAEAAGEDAVKFRLRHLDKHPRHAAVLRAVASAAWDKPLPAGRFRGVAVHESFRSFVAQVVEISLVGDAVKVEKVTCAVDCGIAVNPDIIRAQMESGIGYGLGAAMRNQITFGEGGEVEQSNFPDYQPLRMSDMPEVETMIIQSAQAPTGVGEPGTPPVAPALAAAIYAATGKRVNHLPFVAHGVKFV